jgi:hypothetical protein
VLGALLKRFATARAQKNRHAGTIYHARDRRNRGSPELIAVSTPYHTFSANLRFCRIIRVSTRIYAVEVAFCFSQTGETGKSMKKVKILSYETGA